MGDKEDYLTSYRVFFENFAATVNPEDQLPVNIAGYTITEAELPGEVLYWTTQYLAEKSCPSTLMTPLRRIILDEVRVASKKQPNEFGYKTDESVYIALRLMQAVTARVNDVCLRYLDNSRLDSLPPPPVQREMKTVSCATKNSRRVMEDRHTEIGNLEALFGIETTEPTSFYAVYDGHAGSAAATYCAAHLHQYLVESPHFTDDLHHALRDAFLRTDAEFVRKSNQERACGGSTAVAVAVRARRLLAAWAGDSLALLAKRMRLMQLVRPHKPGRQDERDRIESSGGTVMYWGTWRVNGQLAVSRAIGDAQYKPYVTAKPEIATVDLDGDEDFVVVACDGLWDFVSEDDVALSVYRQIAADPDDLKAVTKRLVVQAKRQGSADNISIIVVFLKDPRDIAADNCPPMDLGLDNALANAPPFVMETEACKRLDATPVVADDCAEAETDNGIDNSDSDSEDLGPETAVDADDLDAEARHHDPAPPTPPAHTVEANHVDGVLVDNVAESGEESEDEWNYFKGEGEREHRAEEIDEPPRSETPCQDNSAWETSSVDMNSSPLNPDAPVFVPGSVAGADVLLAESPRKPVPMDDIELPDSAQFNTDAVVRPSELLDLDNCDQLNGHHNISLDETKEHFNGNDKCNMDSLGFGFSVGLETDKDKGLIQDFERIQKDTTDFCNIQVFQAHAETNPFASETNEELFERLKNKERDPMSMSFYQEKDDDTCERLSHNESAVDLNAVQQLPDSDDEDLQTNGDCHEDDKENVSPDRQPDAEPNNDILRFDDRADPSNNATDFGDNFMDYAPSSNMQNYDFESSNIPQEVATPESHKLLFEQIPEIPDGKSSELGFTNEDAQDPSDSDKDLRAITPQEETSQDVEMESKLEDSPCVEVQPELGSEPKDDLIEAAPSSESDLAVSPEPAHVDDEANDNISELDVPIDIGDQTNGTPLPAELEAHEVAITPGFAQNVQQSIRVEVHSGSDADFDGFDEKPVAESPMPSESPLPAQSPLPTEALVSAQSPFPAEDTLPAESPLPTEANLLSQSPLPTVANLLSQSPFPTEAPLSAQSPLPTEAPLFSQSPLPTEAALPTEAPLLSQSPLPTETHPLTKSPIPTEAPFLSQSPLPTEVPLQAQSPLPTEASLQAQSPPPTEAPLLSQSPLLTEAPLLSQSPLLTEAYSQSPIPTEAPLLAQSPLPTEAAPTAPSPLPTEEFLTRSPLPTQVSAVAQSPLPTEEHPTAQSFAPTETSLPAQSPAPTEELLPAHSPLPAESLLPTEAPLQAESPFPTESPAPEQLREKTPQPDEVPLPRDSPPPAPSAAEEPAPRPETASPAPAPSPAAEPSGPAPDIVPEEPQRSELVTDIDIGIPESRAQEICLPVTSEIPQDDAELAAAATPPPTPGVEPATIAPLSETPIAADPAPADDTAATVAAAAAAVTVAAAAAAASAAKAKPTPGAAKKSPTTPKPAPKTSTTARTPLSARKAAPATATPPAKSLAAKTTPARTPSAAAKPASAAKTTPAKPSTPGARPAPRTTPVKSSPALTKAAPAAKPAPAKEAPIAAKPAPISRAAAAARPAPKAAAPRPAPAAARPAVSAPAAAAKPAARPAAARPASARPAPAAAAPRPRAPERKPLTNGDVKAPAKPAPKPASAAARPAPRPTPRAPVAAAPLKSSAPKPAPRAPAARPPSKDTDKQSKDLANKRITAKAAPPRTTVPKVQAGTKNARAVPKKPLIPATAPLGLANGAAEAELAKPPPSPPLADNAQLPDVIA